MEKLLTMMRNLEGRGRNTLLGFAVVTAAVLILYDTYKLKLVSREIAKDAKGVQEAVKRIEEAVEKLMNCKS